MDKDAHRRRDRITGLSIVAVAFLASLTLSWWASSVATPEGPTPPEPPTTEGIVGFPGEVDVLGTLDAAWGLTVRDQLRGIVAEGIGKDGTLDLQAPGARLRFAFQSRRGEGPQPPRPKGTLPKRLFCGKQSVHVTAEGMFADPDQPTYPCPARRGEALPEPRCGPKDVWQYAIDVKHYPADKRARIEYFRANAGPAWKFEIPGTRYRFTLYGDCGREITGGDAFGSVP